MNLSTEDINDVMFKLSDAGKIPAYLGALPSDYVKPSIFYNRPHPDRPCCFLANYDPSNQAGSHWVAFLLNSGGKNQYFDSFGFDADFDDKILGDKTQFRQFLNTVSNNKPYWFNTFDYQSLQSTTCGTWASVWIFKGGGALKDAQKINNASKRDKWVVQQWQEMIKHS